MNNLWPTVSDKENNACELQKKGLDVSIKI